MAPILHTNPPHLLMQEKILGVQRYSKIPKDADLYTAANAYFKNKSIASIFKV